MLFGKFIIKFLCLISHLSLHLLELHFLLWIIQSMLVLQILNLSPKNFLFILNFLNIFSEITVQILEFFLESI